MVGRSSAGQIWSKSEFSVHVVKYIFKKRSPVEIQAPTYRNLIEHRIIVLQPVLLPNSTLPPPHIIALTVPQEKIQSAIKKTLFQFFVFFV
jgi:hypothetical protein